jgi:hypothetical protein
MYRVTRTARNARAKHPELTAADIEPLPREFPKLRRRIVITDYDFGEKVHTLDLYRTPRIDCYAVHVDGQPWRPRMGWSRILAGLRKSLPRVGSPSRIA